MSLPLLPFDRWLSGTNENSIPANDNSLRSEILSSSAIAGDVTAQPGSPGNGDWYVIPASATGTQWATFTVDSCVIFYDGNWYEFTPVENAIVMIAGSTFRYSVGTGWVPGGTGSGDVTGPGSATADAVAVFDGTTGKLLKNGAKTIAQIKSIEQNSQSTAYTLVLADAGKHILHPSADTTARVFTIPANSSVSFPVGTAITFVNQNAAGVVTISIATDTMRLAGAGTTGSRTLAANGVATALKITSTEWIISGPGLT